MLALSDKIFENKTLMFAVAIIALLVAVALLLLIFRIAFGRKLRMPGGGRARLPRLGIVDAFDLDRQRQLVIIRRDNVEHLLMIGGPNDLVIESEIIRAEARDNRIRDKEIREKDQREAPQAPAAVPWPSEIEAPTRAALSQQQPPRKMPPPPALAPEPELEPSVRVADQPPPPPAAIASPSPRPPAFPMPPRRATQPMTPQRTPVPREPLGRPEPSIKSEAGANPSSAFPRAPLATPFLRPSPPRQLAESFLKPASLPAVPAAPVVSEPPAAAPAAPAPEPAASALPAPTEAQTRPDAEPSPPSLAAETTAPSQTTAPTSAQTPVEPSPPDPFDSLEEEMAKLLGRGPGA